MGCTYTLHVRTEEITDEDMEIFFSNTLGSPLFTWGNHPKNEKGFGPIYKRFSSSPSYEFGEMSFLKAGLSGDDKYLSNCVDIEDFIKNEDGYGELITKELINQIKDWLDDLKNDDSYYGNTMSINDKIGLLKFLKKHKDKKAFFVCW